MNKERKNQDQENPPSISSVNKRLIFGIAAGIVAAALIVVNLIVIFSQQKESSIDKPPQEMVKELQDKQRQQSTGIKKKKEIPKRYGAMSLSVDKQTLAVGDEIEVKILMDTKQSNIVVASAMVEYDPQVLKFISKNHMAETQNSVLKMSVVNKAQSGKIQIVRGAPGDTDYLDNDDGFAGADGLLATLRFKTLKTGSTKIKFVPEESNMVLDDGRGTAMMAEFENLLINVK